MRQNKQIKNINLLNLNMETEWGEFLPEIDFVKFDND